MSGSERSRRAKRLVVNLISANDDEGPSARHQRRKAAKALLDLAEQEADGADIVTRRFIKQSSRRREGIRALFKLSDEELDDVENKAFPTTTTEPTVSIRLLELIREYTKESLFIKTATSVIRSGTQGAAAVLHFVTRMEDFFSYVDHSLIVDFGVRIVKTENSLTRTWYTGLTLLVTAIERTSPDNLSHLAGTLHVALSSVVGGVVQQGSRIRAGAVAKKEKSHFCDPPLLPLVARCCAKSEPVLDLLQFALPPPSILTSFIDLTLNIALEMDASQCRFSLEGGFALTALAFLLQIPTVILYVPPGRLPAIGTLFVDIVLHPKAPEIQSEGSPDEEDMLRWLRTKLDHGVINALSRLPELNFKEALTSALKAALRRFNLHSTNPYQPLEIVERLLWLSNLKLNNEEIHRALVEAGSCAFLVNVLAYTGGLNPQDRGLWRAKGLAITCLGNILEEMDWIQLRDHITADMIDIILKIKGDGGTPMVQKGQAIFLLQRYVLVADRYGIEPYYREYSSAKTTKLESAHLGEQGLL
ncbi:hypothetical protein FRC04_009634 [Tulasnella sp. 424]|nr:hypothetical protein FRC04_009634 [Tulasnella sp. 424]